MERMNGIILHSGEWDRIYHAFNIASVLSSMGEETIVFLTYWALRNICENIKFFERDEEKRAIEEGIQKGIIKELEHIVNLGKSFGKLRIIACSASMELFGIDKEKLPRWVDKVGGLSEVIGMDHIIFI
jgi:peroxiredoxin family protein